jgi:hypothetical protein
MSYTIPKKFDFIPLSLLHTNVHHQQRTYKHNFDIDFFSFLDRDDSISVQQRKDFYVRGCNISINL